MLDAPGSKKRSDALPEMLLDPLEDRVTERGVTVLKDGETDRDGETMPGL